MNNYVKFLTNIPEYITFKFDQPKEYPNKFKPGEMQYSYGVEWKGQDAYLTATPKLNDLFQALPKRQGETIQVLKYEDGTAKLWKIMDVQGNDITPKTAPHAQNAPTSHVTPQSGVLIPKEQYLTLERFNEVLDKQREAFREMKKQVNECVSQIEYFKELWKTQNPDAAEIHKDQIPIITEKDWAEETSEKLFDK